MKKLDAIIAYSFLAGAAGYLIAMCAALILVY